MQRKGGSPVVIPTGLPHSPIFLYSELMPTRSYCAPTRPSIPLSLLSAASPRVTPPSSPCSLSALRASRPFQPRTHACPLQQKKRRRLYGSRLGRRGRWQILDLSLHACSVSQPSASSRIGQWRHHSSMHFMRCLVVPPPCIQTPGLRWRVNFFFTRKVELFPSYQFFIKP